MFTSACTKTIVCTCNENGELRENFANHPVRRNNAIGIGREREIMIMIHNLWISRRAHNTQKALTRRERQIECDWGTRELEKRRTNVSVMFE